MSLSLETWNLIHKIEDEHGTLDIPNDDPDMVKLHAKTGAIMRKQRHPKKAVARKPGKIRAAVLRTRSN